VYGDLAAGRAADDARRPLMPPVEALLAANHSPAAGADALPAVIDAERLPFERWAPFDARRPRLLHRRIDGAPLERLIARCRAERVTVNAALLAAADQAARTLPGAPSTIQLDVPHNVRSDCAPPVGDDQVGLFICDVTIDAGGAADPPTLWDLARALEAAYLAGLPGALRPAARFAIADLAATVDGYRDPARRRFLNGFAVSNLGDRDSGVPAGAPLTLESFAFTTCNAPGVIAVLTCVATVRDVMTCTFSHHEPLLSDRSAEGFADAFINALLTA
jgi:hypothetical protein